MKGSSVIIRRVVACVPAICALLLAAVSYGEINDSAAVRPHRFYHERDYGSDSQFTPIASFINYTFDTLQIPRSFSMRNFDDHLGTVTYDLLNPITAINKSGGFKDFMNHQIFPVDTSDLDASREILPNYTLHLLGGGMVYRKNVEWFESHGYSHPRAYSIAFCVTAEFIQEVIEKKSTPRDDEVADFWIFRPAGMLLFEWEPFARYADEKLNLMEWPYQPVYNTSGRGLSNVGENFAVRPRFFGMSDNRPFIFFGMNTLFGMSHRINETDSVSWGMGQAVYKASRHDVRMRQSWGVFYDRNDSLLMSAIFRGTENLAARVNVYPGVLSVGAWKPGAFVGIGDDGGYTLGLAVRVVPVGIAFDP